MAWLILILAVPYLGIVAFLLFGSTSVGRKRRAWQSEVNARVLEAVSGQQEDTPRSDGVRHNVDDLTRLNQRLGALPMASANTVELLPDYQGSIAAMCAEIEGAQPFVPVQFYLSSWDGKAAGFFEAMAAAAERGVDGPFLFHPLGSRGIPGYKQFKERLN